MEASILAEWRLCLSSPVYGGGIRRRDEICEYDSGFPGNPGPPAVNPIAGGLQDPNMDDRASGGRAK
jgi:hypothetical protein